MSFLVDIICELTDNKELAWTSLEVQWIKNLPANAGDMGSVPGPGRSHTLQSNQAHVPQLLSLCFAAREATTVRSPHTTIKSSPCSP